MDLNDLYFQHRGLFSSRFVGIQCGLGWASLIESILIELVAERPEARIVQVKEKLGGLRIYLENKLDECAKAILGNAEGASFSICEACGATRARTASNGCV